MADQTINEKNIFSSQVTVQSDGLVVSQASLTNTFQQLTNRTRWLFNQLGKIGTTPPSPLLYTNQYQLYGTGGGSGLQLAVDGSNTNTNSSTLAKESQSFTFDSQAIKGVNYGLWSDSVVIADFTANPIAYDITGSNLIIDVDFDADNYQSFKYVTSFGTGTNATTQYNYYFCNYTLSAMVTSPSMSNVSTFGIANAYKPSTSSEIRAHWTVPFPGISNYYAIPPITNIYNVKFDQYGKLVSTPISSFNDQNNPSASFPTVGYLQQLLVTCSFPTFTQGVWSKTYVKGKFTPVVYGAQGTTKIYSVSDGCPNGSPTGNS